MKNAYLDLLNEDTRLFVQSIEESSGIEITVRIDPSRRASKSNSSGTLACEVDAHTALLLIPSRDCFPDSSVVHELLHIKRFLVDRVPRIVICNNYDDWSPEREAGLAKLDNALEHLVIVPKELDKRPSRQVYWRSGVNRALSNILAGSLSVDDSRHLALVHWAFLHQVLPDDELIEKARTILEGMNLANLAASYLDAVVSYLDSKDALVRATFHYLDIPTEGVCLQTMDPRRNDEIERMLSEVEIQV